MEGATGTGEMLLPLDAEVACVLASFPSAEFANALNTG
jgi:hypothetical protein